MSGHGSGEHTWPYRDALAVLSRKITFSMITLAFSPTLPPSCVPLIVHGASASHSSASLSRRVAFATAAAKDGPSAK